MLALRWPLRERHQAWPEWFSGSTLAVEKLKYFNFNLLVGSTKLNLLLQTVALQTLLAAKIGALTPADFLRVWQHEAGVSAPIFAGEVVAMSCLAVAVIV